MKRILLFLSISLSFLAINSTFAQSEKAQKILFVLSSHSELGDTGKETGYYLSEAAHPYEVLHKAGYQIDFVSPKGGKAPVDGFDLDDKVNKAFWENEEIQKQLNNTLKPSQVKAKDYVAIHYVGGHGTMWDFPNNKKLAKIARDIYENEGVVSAVCHGPSGLLNIKLSNGEYLIEGKNVSVFTNEEEEAVKLTEVVPFSLEDEFIAKGAKVDKAENWASKVSVDGRLVTGQNPASAKEVGEAIITLLSEKVN
ncbi:type 1 glutamine amidotransferase domain-containing protein [Sediminitomix flava]|uniref:Putative intracellular protease/amidase n=1 Tax=Sediminitomix flava TaxID=379075 RepID=A0A315ZBA4_SEDFL|nr:type 1 glutamine amidotransferase domain-containing protein [Sediminitomix flava]PWJ42088.1 putative intracellular protease/amidase [Sediminitomix flava]